MAKFVFIFATVVLLCAFVATGAQDPQTIQGKPDDTGLAKEKDKENKEVGKGDKGAHGKENAAEKKDANKAKQEEKKDSVKTKQEEKKAEKGSKGKGKGSKADSNKGKQDKKAGKGKSKKQ